MKKKEKNQTDRRSFIKGGAFGLIGAFCLSAGLKEAIANAKATGKPLLTQDSLNNLFAEATSKKNINKVVKEILKDPVSWLIKNFSVTDIQKNAIKSISSSNWESIKRILKPVAENGGTVRVEISPDTKLSLSAASDYVGKCRGTAKVEAEGEIGGVKVKGQVGADYES